jgi:CheY-like chemotaxis protein
MSPPTVVVVDDDLGFRRVVRHLLTTRGFRVVADAGDGAAALLAVRTHRPDCVLLDVNLPDRDGLAVARALTVEARAPRIVLTSTDAAGFPESALAGSGVRAFVPKDRLAGADLHRLFRSGAA